MDGHAFLDDTFHTAQTDAQFVADQFSDGLDTAVAKVVNIILFLGAVVDFDHVADKVDDVPLGDVAVCDRNTFGEVQLLVQFITANAFQVIVTLVEELLFQEVTGIFKGDRVTGAHLFEKFNQRQFADGHSGRGIPDRFLFEGGLDILAVLVVVNIAKQCQQFFIGPFFDR